MDDRFAEAERIAVAAVKSRLEQELGVAVSRLRRTGGAVVERVPRLSAALDRLDRGEYGTCAECDEPISPARLRALPEVQTCVRCQARLERTVF